MVAASLQDIICRAVIHGLVVGFLWLPTFSVILGLGFIAVGVVLVARGRKNLSRLGRSAVTLIAVSTAIRATAVCLADVGHWSEWGGGAFHGAFIVLYGLIGCGVVRALDTAARSVRRRPGVGAVAR